MLCKVLVFQLPVMKYLSRDFDYTPQHYDSHFHHVDLVFNVLNDSDFDSNSG